MKKGILFVLGWLLHGSVAAMNGPIFHIIEGEYLEDQYARENVGIRLYVGQYNTYTPTSVESEESSDSVVSLGMLDTKPIHIDSLQEYVACYAIHPALLKSLGNIFTLNESSNKITCNKVFAHPESMRSFISVYHKMADAGYRDKRNSQVVEKNTVMSNQRFAKLCDVHYLACHITYVNQEVDPDRVDPINEDLRRLYDNTLGIVIAKKLLKEESCLELAAFCQKHTNVFLKDIYFSAVLHCCMLYRLNRKLKKKGQEGSEIVETVLQQVEQAHGTRQLVRLLTGDYASLMFAKKKKKSFISKVFPSKKERLSIPLHFSTIGTMNTELHLIEDEYPKDLYAREIVGIRLYVSQYNTYMQELGESRSDVSSDSISSFWVVDARPVHIEALQECVAYYAVHPVLLQSLQYIFDLNKSTNKITCSKVFAHPGSMRSFISKYHTMADVQNGNGPGLEVLKKKAAASSRNFAKLCDFYYLSHHISYMSREINPEQMDPINEKLKQLYHSVLSAILIKKLSDEMGCLELVAFGQKHTPVFLKDAYFAMLLRYCMLFCIDKELQKKDPKKRDVLQELQSNVAQARVTRELVHLLYHDYSPLLFPKKKKKTIVL